ncbi:MAG: tyrosine-type recombinase/integrase [Paludibacteraceae bacterium]|nr:recombinase [Bacteroidales bacterium]MBQ2051711.1 tyrosine-type recombinase/integrase [Paludibacteraceae bacterium]MBQ2591334.1 tyrosine-type recombinase/integrase [Paludibacteraceae bacterium]MBQ3681228.1 tyrosine-type recombinase/integrase [Paludibacteraceae bacterium]MBQ3895722.1 tyrosine-type recombinase/integrase [Paludibacteraceae bacterium]
MNVDSFLQYLQKERKYSLNTVQAYENDLLEFSEFCEKRLSKDVLNVGVSDVREWIVEMSDGSGAVGVRTVKRRISALRSFYKYLRREGLVSKNPAAVLVLPKASKPLPKFFREEEMGRLLDDVMTGDEFQDRRDKLIIDLFYQTGVRVSELVEIKDSDIDMGRGMLRVFGKRRKERLIPIGGKLLKEIEAYKAKRNTEVGKTSDLFVRKNGEKMYRRGVYDVVHRSLTKVSSLKKRSPHVLRHTFASTMLNNGADIYAVKALLGHSSLAATEVYTHSSFAKLIKTYKTAHPRA